MKVLFGGIFLIIAIGLLYFTVQIAKSPDFRTAIAPNPSAFGAKGGVDSTSSAVFVDVNNNLSFAFPRDWTQLSVQRIPGFAPLLMAHDGAYLTIATRPIPRGQNIDVDIETIARAFPESIQKSLAVLAGGAVELNAEEIKKLTFKNGISGFRITFAGKVPQEVSADIADTSESQVSPTKELRGNLYAYYVRGEILLAYSVLIGTAQPDSTFLQQAEIVMQGLTIY